MIKTFQYQIVNGQKSEPIPFEKLLKDKDELEKLRKELERKEKCWQENKTFSGIERKQIKQIMFRYAEI